MMAQICKGSNRQITKNFTESEFHSKSLDAPQCHSLDDKVINGLQIIRDSFKTPIRITSTLRTATGNSAIGGVSDSRHLNPARAIDSQPIANRDMHLKKFYDDFKCKGPLYRKLRASGINGIGIYETFIHIDTRPTPSFWDNSAGKWGDVRITNEYMRQIPETGLNSRDCEFESEAIAYETGSKYGITGLLSPLDPRNYSGEDGIKSQESGLIKLLIGGGMMLMGGIVLFVYMRKQKLRI